MAESSEQRGLRHTKRLIINVLWNWMGVAAGIFIAIFLNPYMIRKLGPERYGIWALVFVIIDYFWLFDLGLNTAVVNFTARFWAVRDDEKINQVINTALFYFSGVSLTLMVVTVTLATPIQNFFQVLPAHALEFHRLILLAGVSWALCTVLHIFVSCLDGLQRFDLSNRVEIFKLTVRSIGQLILLAKGYGLVEMGFMVVGCQVMGYVLNFLNFRRIFPALRFSRDRVRLSMLKEMGSYGLNSFLANSSNLALNQGAPFLIGHFQRSEFVGFYTLPSRILQYAVDAVARVGLVARSNSAELDATGRAESVAKLGMFLNRYCFTLFMPLVIVLLTYGTPLIRVWLKRPEFTQYSAPLLPVMSVAIAFAVAGQFNSSSILFGIGKHRRYAHGLMVEAALNVVAMIFVIPRYGILGAAWVAAVLMILNRGLFVPWLVARYVHVPFATYMGSIYLRPILTAIPVFALGLWMRTYWLEGRNWAELLTVSSLIGTLYLGAAFFTCIDREHRRLLEGWVWRRIRRERVTLNA